MSVIQLIVDGVKVYDSGGIVPPNTTTCPAGQHWDGAKCVPDVVVPPTPVGEMGVELASAVSLQIKNGNSGLFGYVYPGWPAVQGTGGHEYYMPGGNVPVWFLVDSKVMGFAPGVINTVSIGDMTQGDGPAPISPMAWVYPIDEGNNVVHRIPNNKSTFPWVVPLPNGQGTTGNLINTYRYLIKITCLNPGKLWVNYK